LFKDGLCFLSKKAKILIARKTERWRKGDAMSAAGWLEKGKNLKLLKRGAPVHGDIKEGYRQKKE